MLAQLLCASNANLLLLLLQVLCAWLLWSVRRAFVRQEDWLAQKEADARRRAATNRRLALLEEHLRCLPDTAAFSRLHGDIQTLHARIDGLAQLMQRMERALERQENHWIHPLPFQNQGENHVQ